MAAKNHHPTPGIEDDPLDKKVGVLISILGVALTIVTISAHRAHSEALLARSAANDQWAYYQAKKNREHISKVGREIILALDHKKADSNAVQHLESAITKYQIEEDKIKADATQKERDADVYEKNALQLDLGEGFLEFGIVLTSFYFLSKRKTFVGVGFLIFLIGTLISTSVLI